jgi:type IV secretory pathway TraG/TraD family ATPase VirD4
MWRRIFANADRQDDLLVFEPGGPLRFNFLDCVVQSGGDTRQITKCLTSIGETLRSGDSNGREEGQFWEREQERMIYNAVEIVKLATGRVTAPDLQQFITTAAKSTAEISSTDWQEKFHSQCMHRAYAKLKSPGEQHDYELAQDYWLGQIPEMADRTKSSILVGVMGLLHVFNTSLIRELVSGTTNVTPDDMLESGRWILVNMPPAQWGDAGKFINAGWKFLTEWRVLRREAQPSDFVNVIWADEAHQFLTGFDSHYLGQSRSHLGCVCFLTQSLHSYYAALPGMGGRHQADALLSNLNLRILHALGDAESAQWASGLVGKELKTFIGGSTAPQEDLFDTLMGRSQFTGSFSQHYEHILQPNVFMNGLRTGGPANRYVVDAIVIKSGEPFADGRNFLWTSFSQR